MKFIPMPCEVMRMLLLNCRVMILHLALEETQVRYARQGSQMFFGKVREEVQG